MFEMLVPQYRGYTKASNMPTEESTFFESKKKKLRKSQYYLIQGGREINAILLTVVGDG